MNAIMEKIVPMPKAAIPLNEPAERAAISCLMQNFANLDAMSWPEDLFFYEKHKLILGTIRKLHEDGFHGGPGATRGHGSTRRGGRCSRTQ
jgi:hypothetical protein